MNLKVEINSINKARNDMVDVYNELISTINNYKKMSEETSYIYDTDSAFIYRKISNAYVSLVEKYLNDEFKPYIDKLQVVEDKYNELFNYISSTVRGEKNE